LRCECKNEKKEAKCSLLLKRINGGNKQALKDWQSRAKPKECSQCKISVCIAEAAGVSRMSINA